MSHWFLKLFYKTGKQHKTISKPNPEKELGLKALFVFCDWWGFNYFTITSKMTNLYDLLRNTPILV